MEKNVQPDVLVKWKRNGGVNIVNLKDLQITSKQKHIKKGTRVRMRGRHTWWAGKIIDIVTGDDSLESDQLQGVKANKGQGVSSEHARRPIQEAQIALLDVNQPDDEDDVPLALLADQLQGVKANKGQGVSSEHARRPIQEAQIALLDVNQPDDEDDVPLALLADQLQGVKANKGQGVSSEHARRPIQEAQIALLDVNQPDDEDDVPLALLADQLQGVKANKGQGVSSEHACRPIHEAQIALLDVDQPGGSSACFELLSAVPLDFALTWDDIYSIPNKELEYADIPDEKAMQPHTNATSTRTDDDKSEESEEEEEEMSTSSESEGELQRGMQAFQRREPDDENPEDFVIDESVGDDTMPLFDEDNNPVPHRPKTRNLAVKYNRNRGLSYYSEKSKKYVEGRKNVEKEKCAGIKCSHKKACALFNNAALKCIREEFYGMANLKLQREYIARHVHQTGQARRSKKKYTLPNPTIPGTVIEVCRKTFLYALGIAYRQVRTVLSKKNRQSGVLEGEKRGGVQKPQHYKRRKIFEHLRRFPRVESHYCRKTSKCTYVSHELTRSRMYRMYKKESPGGGSFSLYKKVMREENIKIHRPKKDKCGLCETYLQANEGDKRKLHQKYMKHREEIGKVRTLKQESKKRAEVDPTHNASVFDLQQNIYLPKSNRGEIFYKRRLACYNFTIYDLASHEGFCYLSNETLTRRGSCEVSSYLLHYLEKLDGENKVSVDFYCDGCVGQNKNSVLPAMFKFFLSKSKNIRTITVHYFETSHGQSEGDSMHSAIEKRISSRENIYHPCQVASIIEDARHSKPYAVHHVQTHEIRDWKSYGQSLGVLRNKEADDGTIIDWTKIKQVRVDKGQDSTIAFKHSHTQDELSILTMGNSRNLRSAKSDSISCADIGTPAVLYSSRPRLASGKYEDLLSLCSGNYPLIMQRELVEFYENLPHE